MGNREPTEEECKRLTKRAQEYLSEFSIEKESDLEAYIFHFTDKLREISNDIHLINKETNECVLCSAPDQTQFKIKYLAVKLLLFTMEAQAKMDGISIPGE